MLLYLFRCCCVPVSYLLHNCCANCLSVVSGKNYTVVLSYPLRNCCVNCLSVISGKNYTVCLTVFGPETKLLSVCRQWQKLHRLSDRLPSRNETPVCLSSVAKTTPSVCRQWQKLHRLSDRLQSAKKNLEARSSILRQLHFFLFAFSKSDCLPTGIFDHRESLSKGICPRRFLIYSAWENEETMTFYSISAVFSSISSRLLPLKMI